MDSWMTYFNVSRIDEPLGLLLTQWHILITTVIVVVDVIIVAVVIFAVRFVFIVVADVIIMYVCRVLVSVIIFADRALIVKIAVVTVGVHVIITITLLDAIVAVATINVRIY